jgi:hypothetical protein
MRKALFFILVLDAYNIYIYGISLCLNILNFFNLFIEYKIKSFEYILMYDNSTNIITVVQLL